MAASLELIDPQGSLVEQLSKPVLWQSSARFLGSPTAEEDPRPSVAINEVLSASSNDDSMDRIELQNVSSTVVDLSGWYLSDSAREPRKYQIPDGVQLEPGQFVVFDETDFNPNPIENNPTDFALSRMGDDVWLSILSEDSDRDRTFVDDVHFPAAEEGVPFGRVPNGDGRLVPVATETFGRPNADHLPGAVVITELNYHPSLPSDAALAVEPDLQTQDLEYLELYNATDSTIDLTNWRLRGGIDFDLPAGQLLTARSTLLVLPFDPHQTEHASRAEAFRVHYDLDTTVAWVGGYDGKLGDSMDWVRLLRGFPVAEGSFAHVLEDEVVYDDRPPWPLSADGQGATLQRRGPEAYGNDAASWQGKQPTPGTSPQVAGDLDDDGAVTAADIDLFCRQRPTQDGRLGPESRWPCGPGGLRLLGPGHLGNDGRRRQSGWSL